MDKKLYLKNQRKDRNPENALVNGAARILSLLKEELARQGRANIHGFGTFTVKTKRIHFSAPLTDGQSKPRASLKYTFLQASNY